MGKSKSILFTVGPVEMDQKTLKLGSAKLPYFRTDEFSKINTEIAAIIKKIAFTSKNSKVVILTASGTGAMEATIISTFTKKDRLLIVNGGTFGERFVDICKIHQIPYLEIKLERGKTLTKEKLAIYKNHNFTGFLINAHETSTGVYYDLKMIGAFCKKQNLILVADAISSFLIDPYFMDKWNIDATIISSQKGLALPPGISIIILNKKIMKKIDTTPALSLYFNLKNYVKEMGRGQTPYTPAVGIILQLHKKLQEIKKIGIKRIIRDTKYLADDFRKKIKSLPFTIASDRLSNGLTPLAPRQNISAYFIFQYLVTKYNIYLNPNGGCLKHKLIRVGHMGSLQSANNDRLVSIFKKMERDGLL